MDCSVFDGLCVENYSLALSYLLQIDRRISKLSMQGLEVAVHVESQA